MQKYNGPIALGFKQNWRSQTKRLQNALHYYGNFKFKVNTSNRRRLVMDLVNRSCTCGQWDLTGIPYEHVVTCIYKSKEKLESYVDGCYKKDTFIKTYNLVINLVLGEEWRPKKEFVSISPPKYTPHAGRPKTKRKRVIDEHTKPYKVSRKGQLIMCNTCGIVGHNSRTCKRPPFPNKKKKMKRSKKKKKGSKSLDFCILYFRILFLFFKLVLPH